MSTLAAYNWLKNLPKELLPASESPLFGMDKLIDLPRFGQKLEKALKLNRLEITLSPFELKEYSKAVSEPERASKIFFELSPLRDKIAVLYSEASLQGLLEFFVNKSFRHHLVDKELKEGFEHFLFMEVMDAFQSALEVKEVSPIYRGKEGAILNQPQWMSLITFKWEGGAFSAHLLFPDSMREEWKNFFEERQLVPSKTLYSSLFLDVHVEIGKTALKKEEWKKVKVGDYVVLDSCQFIPSEDKGRALLTVNGIPAFRAKIKNGTLKILETPQFNEIGTSMSMPPKHDESAFEDSETLEEDLTEHEETEEYFDEEETESHEAGSNDQALSYETVSQKPFRADDIPLNIVVEAGRFRMTAEKLSALEPGTVVDLHIRPEEGVDLVVNGMTIAKGELLKIGDTLGVRILDIAK